MAIYYYPYPLSTPASTNFSYAVGDYFINQNGAIFRAAAGTGLSAGKLVWPQPTGVKPPVARPSITATTLVNNNTATRNNTFSVAVVKAVGGAAIVPTGGTSVTSPGTTPVLNFTVSPALPAGVILTPTKSVVTIVNTDATSNLFNQVELTLSGTPTVASSQTTYVVTFTDSNGQIGSTTFNFTVESGLAVLSSTLSVASRTLTQFVAATTFTPVTGSGGVGALTYAISPSLPSGLTFNTSTGAISGTSSAILSQTNFTVTISDTADQTTSKSFSLTVNAPPAITPATSTTIPTLTQGVAVTPFIPVSGSGGIAPLTYTISPSLPTGLAFNTSTGQITGTPTGISGTTTYTVTITDSIGQTSSGTFTLTVNAAAITTTVSLSSVSLTQNVAANPFTPVTASGGFGTFTYAVSPSLPNGLSINSSTGQITGTPTVTIGQTTFTVTVTDQANQTSSKTFSLTVSAPSAITTTQAVASSSLIINTNATAFIPVTASGGYGTLTYAVSPGLPTGLAFNTANGQITGTPTALSGATTYTVTVTDALNQTSSKTFSLTVTNPPVVTTVAVSTKTVTQGAIMSAFTPVTGSGGVGALTYAVSPSLPNGLSFNAASGQISGTPTVSLTTTTFTVTVSDTAGQTSNKTFNLTVNAPPALTTTVNTGSSTFIRGVSITAYNPVSGSGGSGTLTYAVSPSLPTGLSFITSTGQITGTPTVISSQTTYTVTVSDAASQTSSATFNITVEQPPAITTTLDTASITFTKLQAAIAVAPVSAAGGYGSITFSVSPSLPAGVTLNSSNGKVGGTPTNTSSGNFTITATDSLGQTSSKTFSLSVINPTLTTVQNVLSRSIVQNIAITSFIPVSGSGGTGSYSYAISPSLPNGLTFNTSTGQISGTPTSIINTTIFTITVTDSDNATASNTFNLTVTAPPALVLTPNVSTVTLTQGVFVATYTPVAVSGGAGTKTYSISPSLPSGLNFNTANGTFSGTPTSVSNLTTYTFTVTDQALQSQSVTFSIEVSPPQIVLTVNYATNIFTQYSQITTIVPVSASEGSGSLTYAISPSLPTGVTFNTNTGSISGTPTSVLNLTTFTITVTDSLSQTESATFTIVVNEDPPTPITTVINVNPVILTRNEPVELTPVTATGGEGALVYSIDPNILPTGLSFSSSTGAITGIPTAVFATSTFTITVTDIVPQTSSRNITIEVKEEFVEVGKGYTGSRGFVGSFGYTGSQGYTGSRGFTGSAGVGYTGSKGDPGTSVTILGSLNSITNLPASGNAGDSYLINGDLYVWTGSQWTNVGQIQGPLGYTGSVGDIGYTGSAGAGYTGSEGYTGSQGFTGSRGFIGYTGSVGYAGSVGDIGYTGSAGAGFTGSQGDTGYTGSQGDTGYTGSQGMIGYTGSVGYTGSQGDTGYTGSQGIIGYTGSKGYVGSQGDIGFTGSQGNIGFTGSTGYTGSQGDTGYTGSKGDRGYSGSVGYVGSQGDTGYTGSVGIGYTGSKGADGTSVIIIGTVSNTNQLPNPYNGNIGDAYIVTSNGHLHIWTGSSWTDAGNITGPIGLTGSRGNIGYTGSRGYTGSQGDIGYVGSQGDIGFTGSRGYTGSQGNSGFVGSRGETGYIGSFGYTGSQGDIGFTGSQGDIGFTGSKGYTGSQGDTGYTGSQGDIGFTGSRGYTGSQGEGFTGSQGDVGYTGSVGFTGSQGVGFTGSRGTIGFSGSRGDSGYTGSVGFTGSQGIPGEAAAVGYTGSAGTNGYTGSQGVMGYTGSASTIIGYTGSAGFSGSVGFTGSQGIPGEAAAMGYTGSVGFTGSQGVGFTGSQGDIGYTGSRGQQGTLGFTGSQGVGFTGSKGDQGEQGLRGYTGSAGTGGGGGAFGNFDGGQPDSNYGGISSIDAGGVTA